MEQQFAVVYDCRRVAGVEKIVHLHRSGGHRPSLSLLQAVDSGDGFVEVALCRITFCEHREQLGLCRISFCQVLQHACRFGMVAERSVENGV